MECVCEWSVCGVCVCVRVESVCVCEWSVCGGVVWLLCVVCVCVCV